MNYYDILNISHDSNNDTIKKAYKKLAIKWHPDKNPDNIEEATRKFKEISEAYQVLSDLNKKEEYDKYGTTSVQFKSPEEIFSQLFSKFDPIVSSFLTNTLTKITESFINDKSKSVWDVVNEIDKEELIEGGSTVVKKILMKNFAKKHKGNKKPENERGTYLVKLTTDDIDIDNEINIDIKFARRYRYINIELSDSDKNNPKNFILDTDFIEHIITYLDHKYNFILTDKLPPGYERYKNHNLIITYNLDIKYKNCGFFFNYPYQGNEILEYNIVFLHNSNIVKIPNKGLMKYSPDDYGDLFIIFNFTDNQSGDEQCISKAHKTLYTIDPLLLINDI